MHNYEIEMKTIQTALAAFLARIAQYLGIIIVPIVMLCAFMVIDYITGMIAAWRNKNLSSKKGVFGIVKKISYLALVSVGMGVDWLIYSGLKQVGYDSGYTIFFGVWVAIWLVINELISILENLKNIGVPLPGFLVSVVKRLKISTENKIESEENKND